MSSAAPALPAARIPAIAGRAAGVGRAAAGRVAAAGRASWPWVRVTGGVAILALLGWRVGGGAFLAGLRVIDGGMLLIALGIGALTTVCGAWRWCLVCRGLGLRLPLGTAVADCYRALFLNAALPGGVLGDVHRAVRHGGDTGDVGRGVRAVVLERAAGQVVLVAVGAVVLLTGPPAVSPFALLAGPPPLAYGLLAGALLAAGAVGFRASRGSSRYGRALRVVAREVRHGLLSRRAWPGVAVASTVMLAGHLATFVLAARAAGSSASVGRLLPLLTLALLAMALPVNVGGWGPREGICAWAFGAAGLGAAQGLTTAVVYGVFAFVASLPGLLVLLAGRRATAAHTTGGPEPTGDPEPIGAPEPAGGQVAPKRSDRA